MKSEIAFKFLSYFSSKKRNNDEGMTLIELLIVMIIIAILAAIAWPNLLGQIGKARETEAKNFVGSTMRAEQAYHYENGVFTGSLSSTQLQAPNVLGIVIPSSKYHTFKIVSNGSNIGPATAFAEGIDSIGNTDNGAFYSTRDYGAGIIFNNGDYKKVTYYSTISGYPIPPINPTQILTNTPPTGTTIVQ